MNTIINALLVKLVLSFLMPSHTNKQLQLDVGCRGECLKH